MEERLESIKHRLDAELTELEREMRELGATADGSIEVSLNEGFADAAQTTSERASVLSMIDTLRQRRDDVIAAQSRLERGTYGRCERCGSEINPERLEAIPVSRLCIACAQKK